MGGVGGEENIGRRFAARNGLAAEQDGEGVAQVEPCERDLDEGQRAAGRDRGRNDAGKAAGGTSY